MDKTALEPGMYYHIYNRGTNGEILFKTEEYFSTFLKLYATYICPVAETLAYCLMSNHFHLLIRTKEEREILTFTELKIFENNKDKKTTDRKPTASGQFSHLFNAYAKTINKAYQRTGSLFEHPFERRIIETEHYLRNCICYIHHNPVKAGFVISVEDYKWSSFCGIISEKPSLLERKFVIDLFGGKDLFLRYHGKDPATFEDFLTEISTSK